MECVVTLVAAEEGVVGQAAERARRALAAAGAEPGGIDWLRQGTAVELAFAAAEPGGADERLRRSLDATPVDFSVQPLEKRRKRILVADMESTIIGQEMIDELAKHAGIGDKIAGITARSMAGEIDFASSLRMRTALLAGLSAKTLDRAAAGMTLNPGARELIATLRGHDCFCALVSGGFTCFAERIAEACGFDALRANRLVIRDSRLTGEVEEPVLGREAKDEALREFAEARGVSLEETCAVGDGANDLAMLRAAGLGVAYRGKPRVRAAVRHRIDHTDLTALLYFQGFHRDEFRTSLS